MRQSPLLVFESQAFADPEGTDNETNPGIFGKTLANWLSEQLKSLGSTPGEVIAEDFGWCVPLGGKRLYVACSSGEATNEWQVFVFAEGGFLSRLFGKHQSSEALISTFAALKGLLEQSSQVRGLREDAA